MQRGLESNSSVGRGYTLAWLYGVGAVPFALLSTNLTLGLPLPETSPIIFLFAGMTWVLVRGELRAKGFLWFPLTLSLYGLFGIAFGDPVDSFRIVTAATIALFALQLGFERTLPRSCRIVIYVLLALRIASLVATETFVALYRALGLRDPDLYGGGVAIVFAEPSYLATAVLACWAIGRRRSAQPAVGIQFLDLAAAAILILSYSASAALYALIGTLLVIRQSKVVLLALGIGALLAMTSLVAFQFDRVLLFIEAIVSIAETGSLSTFVALDPSAAWRLTSTMLTWASAQAFPLGQFQLELGSVVASAEATDTLGVVASNPLTYAFQGNRQGTTVAWQMLIFGGWPLFLAFLALSFWSLKSLLRKRADPTAVLLIGAAILCGLFLQSQLTSPFLWLCLAAALSPELSLPPSRASRGAATNNEPLSSLPAD